MRLGLFMAVLISTILGFGNANAQYSAQKKAEYLATIKAVSAYKIEDQEEARNVERLRQDARFNAKLQKMLSKLSNDRTKDTKNKQVLKILEDAGEQIYKLLD